MKQKQDGKEARVILWSHVVLQCAHVGKHEARGRASSVHTCSLLWLEDACSAPVYASSSRYTAS